MSAPTPNEESRLTVASNQIKLALVEWTPSLFDQPTQPPFRYNAKLRKEEERVARLSAMVVLITFVSTGAVRLFDKTTALDIPGRALVLLIGCILVGIAYKPFSYICGVRIYESPSKPAQPGLPLSLRQSVFSVIFIFIPWVPILAFIRSRIPETNDPYQDLLLLIQFICFGYILFNFAKAIRLISNCPRYRIWLSITLPLIVLGIILTKVI